MKYRVYLKGNKLVPEVSKELDCLEFLKWLEYVATSQIIILRVEVNGKEIDFKSLIKNLKFK